MSLVRIDWHPGPKQLRSFGAVFLTGFLLIGALFWWRGVETAAIVCVSAAFVVGAIGLTGTRVALPFYWAWMGIAFVMGNIMSRVVIALVYFAVLTPIGIAQRLAGRDRLQLKRTDQESYWIDLDDAPPPEKYERQF